MRIIIFLVGFVCLAKPKFDSSSVTAGRSGSPGLSMHVQYVPQPITLTMQNVTLKFCLQQAYGLTEHQVSGPGWIRSRRYDVTATLAGGSQLDQVWPALQSLLDERFKLSLEHETIQTLAGA
jgi:uncharacterized protein (TIGR03435 family)